MLEVQPLEVGVLIVTAVAFTAPVSSVDPVADAHFPTFAAALVAVTDLVTVLDDVSVTVIASADAVADGVADAVAPRFPPNPPNPPVRSVPEITTVWPDTEVTLPKAVAKFIPAPFAPDGRVPVAPLGIAPP